MDMDNGIDESTGPLCLDKTSKEVSDFECHICLQLPEDPIVTLCGHLYCWPCIYRWLHRHSRSHECPVCKAFVEEEKLVPIYGRGRTSLDPKCRSIAGGDIPKRPVGQRLEAVPPPAPVGNFFHQEGDGLVVGSMHSGTARVGNFTFSAAFGGLTPPLNVQLDSNFGGDVEAAGEGEPLQDQSLADRVTRLEWTLGRFIEETRGRLDRMEGQLNAFEGRFEYLNGYVDRTEEMLRHQQQ